MLSTSHSYSIFLWIWTLLAPIICLVLFRVTAPYGRHLSAGWGFAIDRSWGWFIQESPALWFVIVLLVVTHPPIAVGTQILLVLWMLHYAHRVVLFPLRIPSGTKTLPIFIIASAFVFNLTNGYIQLCGLFSSPDRYATAWLTQPITIVGLLMFVGGALVNIWSDHSLITRQNHQGTAAYLLPTHGLFVLVSCPNYLGEIIEWAGWGLATRSLEGASFALWTAANLIPRAQSHHRWYKKTFASYPKNRRALIPYIW